MPKYPQKQGWRRYDYTMLAVVLLLVVIGLVLLYSTSSYNGQEIGRASCRERVSS